MDLWKWKRAKGFTLVEMMVVITIIMVLASMLVVGLGRAQKRASALQCMNNLRMIGNAVIGYANSKGGGFLPNFSFGMGAESRVADQWVWELDFISEADRYLSRQLGVFDSVLQDAILPPRMAPPVLRCPADVQLFVNGQSCLTSYWMHPANTFKVYATLTRRSSTMLGIEGDALLETNPNSCGCRFHLCLPPKEIDTTHFGGGHCLFADGSVKLIDNVKERKLSYWEELAGWPISTTY